MYIYKRKSDKAVLVVFDKTEKDEADQQPVKYMKKIFTHLEDNHQFGIDDYQTDVQVASLFADHESTTGEAQTAYEDVQQNPDNWEKFE